MTRPPHLDPNRYCLTGLDEDREPLEEPDPPAPISLAATDILPEGAVALLHLDDLHPESLPLGRARVVRVGGLLAHADGAAERVRQADRDAMTDALAQAEAHFRCYASMVEDAAWAGNLAMVAAWAPVGPSAEALPPCLRVRRNRDSLTWPEATRGYFQVKAAIPRILQEAGFTT